MVAHEVLPQSPRVGRVQIRLRLTDASRKPLTGAEIRLEGNMSHAGMSPVFVDALEVAPGEYRANMDLSMAGDWVVLVHLTLSDGAKLERQFEMTVLNAEDVR
ncbi:MAG TPA: FixH family protein [Pyrinomonadaceae bacterium]|nr:FixH family protein [Pyrinomonadaceae bacterium]